MLHISLLHSAQYRREITKFEVLQRERTNRNLPFSIFTLKPHVPFFCCDTSAKLQGMNEMNTKLYFEKSLSSPS